MHNAKSVKYSLKGNLFLEARQSADEEDEDAEDDDTAAGQAGFVHQFVNQIANHGCLLKLMPLTFPFTSFVSRQ